MNTPAIRTTTVAAALSMHMQALKNLNRVAERSTLREVQAEWREKHLRAIELIEKEFLPSGSGFDNGTFTRSADGDSQLIVLDTSFHHMVHGNYTCWTQHTLRVRPRFDGGLDMTITGRNTNGILSFILDTFRDALLQPLLTARDGITYQRAPEPLSPY